MFVVSYRIWSCVHIFSVIFVKPTYLFVDIRIMLRGNDILRNHLQMYICRSARVIEFEQVSFFSFISRNRDLDHLN